MIASTFNLVGSLTEILDESFEGLMVEGMGTLTEGMVVNTTKAGHELIYQYYKTTMLGMNISGVIGVFYCEDSQRVYQLLTMMFASDTEQEAIQYFQPYLDSFSGH